LLNNKLLLKINYFLLLCCQYFKNKNMTRLSITFLQTVLILIGLITIIILIWGPLNEGRATNLSLFKIYTDPLILYIYTASITFFSALYQAFKLLIYISQNKVFTSKAVKTLQKIKYCGIILCGLILFVGLYIKIFHSKEDDPAGFLAICIVTTFSSFVVATAAAIFEKLLQNAVDIKTENDLTV